MVNWVTVQIGYAFIQICILIATKWGTVSEVYPQLVGTQGTDGWISKSKIVRIMQTEPHCTPSMKG